MEEQKDVKGSNNQQIAGAILIAGIIIGGAIMLKGSTPPTSGNTGTVEINTEQASKIRPVNRDEHILGNPNAKVVIVEYSDTECPFCKMFHNTMHQVIMEKGGEVAWVYRHYPLEQLHKKAFHEAEATECAWEQGGNDTFWKYVDELYARTGSNDSLNVSELPKIATDIGLNVTTFNTCLENRKYKTKIEEDMINGNLIGVNGTPSSFILKNGKIFPFIGINGATTDNIPGAQPFDIVMQNLDRALK